MICFFLTIRIKILSNAIYLYSDLQSGYFYIGTSQEQFYQYDEGFLFLARSKRTSEMGRIVFGRFLTLSAPF